MEGLGTKVVELSNSEMNRYTRQIRLSEIGVEGQARLKASRVLIVGAGGLGSPAAYYLAAAGVGTLGVIDADRVDESNLHRQVFYSVGKVGALKVEALGAGIKDLNPHITVHTYPFRLTSENSEEILKHYDIVLDGSDNFATRYLVNDTCVVLGKPLVSSSIYKFEGQLTVFNALMKDGTRGPTLRCLFPKPPPSEDAPACGEVGVLGVLPGVMGLLQANEVLKLICGFGEPLSGKLLVFNALTTGFRTLHLNRDDQVAEATKILASYENICEGESIMKEITPLELKAKLDAKEELVLIDVREPHEREIASIGGELIPMNTIPQKVSEIPKDKPVVIYCRSGGRSGRVVQELQRNFGYTNLLNLAGGILRWSDDVDPTVQKY